jgi:hypothetical protein
MRYYPAPGRTVRDPRTRALVGADGIEVGPHDFDLARQVAWGDLVPEPPEAAAPEEPAPAIGAVATVAPVGATATSVTLGAASTSAASETA